MSRDMPDAVTVTVKSEKLDNDGSSYISAEADQNIDAEQMTVILSRALASLTGQIAELLADGAEIPREAAVLAAVGNASLTVHQHLLAVAQGSNGGTDD